MRISDWSSDVCSSDLPSTRRSERSARRSARRRRSMSDRSGGTRTGAQVGSGTGLVSPLEERLDLGLLVAAVAAERVARGEVAALRPAGDRLRVDLEQSTALGRGEQWLVVERGPVVRFGWGSKSYRNRPEER